MRLRIVAVGRLKAGPERALADDYAARATALGRALGFEGPETIELDESRAAQAARRMADEAAEIGRRLAGAERRVAFDAKGEALTSEAFAKLLTGWRDDGVAEAALVLGGPDGLDPAVKARADMRVSFGRMIWPHRLARIMLLEQIYRAMTIAAGHPYHRA